MKTKIIDEAYQFVLSVAKMSNRGKSTPVISFYQSKSNFIVSSSQGDFQIKFSIENKSKEWNQTISVDGNLLAKVFKGVDTDVSIEPNENYSSVNIKKKGFKGTYNSLSYESAGFTDSEDNFNNISFIKNIINTSIKSMESMKTLVDYSRYIRVVSDGTNISCGTGDNYHVLFVTKKEIHSKIDFCIPVELAKLLSTKHINIIKLSQTRLKAYGDNVELETSLIPPNKVIDVSLIPSMIKRDQDSCFTVKLDNLISYLSSTNAKDSPTILITFFSEKKPVINVKSSNFETKQQIEAHSIKSSYSFKTVELNSQNFTESLLAFDKKQEVTIKGLGNSISISSLEGEMVALLAANKVTFEKG